MSRKELHLHSRSRQRQRMSRKMIIILGSSIVCLVIALVILFNISNVDESKAALRGSTSKNVVIIEDEVYPTAFNQDNPPVARIAPVAANVQLGHVIKPLPATN